MFKNGETVWLVLIGISPATGQPAWREVPPPAERPVNMLTRCPGCGVATWDGEHHCNGGKR